MYVPAFKRWIVEQAKVPGMSLAGLAMRNEVNANQLRRWVQLDAKQPGQWVTTATLLPVKVVPQEVPAPMLGADATAGAVSVEIELAGVIVRVRDGITPATLRVVLSCLRGTAA